MVMNRQSVAGLRDQLFAQAAFSVYGDTLRRPETSDSLWGK